jgi:hypothetical protein
MQLVHGDFELASLLDLHWTMTTSTNQHLLAILICISFSPSLNLCAKHLLQTRKEENVNSLDHHPCDFVVSTAHVDGLGCQPTLLDRDALQPGRAGVVDPRQLE